MPRVLIGADIHGAYEELVSQVQRDDILVLCGDYLDFFDYETRDGLIVKLIPKDMIERALKSLESGKKTEESKKMVGEIVRRNPNLAKDMIELVNKSYEQLFSTLECKAYLTFGNVDYPQLIKQHARPHHIFVDGALVEIADEKFGFVGGLPPTTYTFGLPGEVDESDFIRKLDRVREADILITHCPPAIADLTYDVRANRDEEGNPYLLKFIEDFAPKINYFGHVHYPKKAVSRHYDTKLINVGYFKRTKRLLVHKTF